MTASAAMTILATAILLIVVYIAIAMAVNSALNQRTRSGSINTLAVHLVVLAMYIVVCTVFAMMYIFSGYDSFIIYCELGIGVILILILFIRFCIRHRRSMNTRYLVLFIVYFALVLFLTVFMRIGMTDTTIKTTPFDDLRLAILTGDVTLINHMILNILFFLPFGMLVPAMNPDHFHVWSFSLLGGLTVSTVIETVQMVFQIGESDIDDIIANTIGAILGYAIISLIWKVQKNWKLD